MSWERVRAAFEEGLEREGEDRDAWLATLAAEDPALAEEVASLLAAHDDGPLRDRSGATPGGAGPERIGEYRLVRHLGEGGMGSVFLALRERPEFTQTVALKLLRGPVLDRRIEERFAEERRILARLEHPGIARLIDGGVTPDGRPYFAMEHVEGVDLLTHADRSRLGVEARIELFLSVCEAVHHAHQRLVVHRDLKPTNVLVTRAGRPKLLDFGIAKLLEEEDREGRITRTTPWLTPAYASPEQLAGRPESVHSDVYSLGVILYELLTGTRPFATRDVSPAELERRVAAAPPERPSQRFASDRTGRGSDTVAPGPPGVRDDRAARALLRGSTPERLRRRLAGDLDTVVLKALSPDPERRYGSAAQLAADLRRHLEGRTVTARPDSTVYRLSRFVRRHRTGVGAAVVVVLSLLAGITVAARQAGEARLQAAAAAAEAERARRVQDLVADVFRLADPESLRGDSLTALEVLDRGTAQIRAELADQPDTRGALLGELARIYRNLGQGERAAVLADESVALLAAASPGSAEHAAALALLADLEAEAGRSDEAVAHYQEALRRRAALVEGPDSVLAAVHARLGWELRARGDHDGAAARFETALEIQRAALGEAHPAVASSLMGLAAAYHDLGLFDRAEALFRDVLDRRAEEVAPDPVVASALLNLGMITRLRERFEPALPPLRTALEMRRRLYGDDHPATLEAVDQLGSALHSAGRWREARGVLAGGLDRAATRLGPHHALATDLRETLARVEADLGVGSVAAARFDTVLADKRAARGDDHPSVAFSLVSWGDALAASGRPSEARDRWREAVTLSDRISGGRSVYGALARQRLGRLALEGGRWAEADSLFARAEAVLVADLREDHRYLWALRRDRALLTLARGDAHRAAEQLDAVVRGLRVRRPDSHPAVGEALVLLGQALEAAGDTLAARNVAVRARAALVELPADHPLRRGWITGSGR